MKHLKLLLRSLVSNNACVEAARTREKKYNIIAVVFALVALFFSVLPMTVTNLQQRGSAWVSSEITYNYKPGMYNFCRAVKDNGVALEIEPEKTLSIDDNLSKVFVSGTTSQPILSKDKKSQMVWQYANVENYYHYTYGDETKYDSIRCLEVYDLTDLNDTDFNDYVTALLNNTNPWVKSDSKDPEANWLQYTQTRKDEESEWGDPVKLARSTSCIFFGKKNVYGYIFQPGNSSIMGSVGGDYLSTRTGDLFGTLGVVEALDKPNPEEEVAKVWIPFWDQVYDVTRWNNAWRSTGIMIGVNVGVLLFMGLMVFLLTRGKNNPFRIYSFWDCQKISYYCSLMAGLIALFGFLLKPLAMMMFVLILGVRVMWCSMRTLRYTPAPK